MGDFRRTYHKIFCIASKPLYWTYFNEKELCTIIGFDHTVKLETIEAESECNEAIWCMTSDFFIFQTIHVLFYKFHFLNRKFRLVNSNAALSKITNNTLKIKEANALSGFLDLCFFLNKINQYWRFFLFSESIDLNSSSMIWLCTNIVSHASSSIFVRYKSVV